MNVKTQELGYREVNMLAELMLHVSENGLFDDVAESFYFDYPMDSPICNGENGSRYTLVDGNIKEVE